MLSDMGCVTVRSVSLPYEFDDFYDQHCPAMLRLAQITTDTAGTLRLEDGPMSLIEEFQQSSIATGRGLPA